MSRTAAATPWPTRPRTPSSAATTSSTSPTASGGPTRRTAPTSRKRPSTGSAATTSAAAPSCGAARATATATSTSRPTPRRASPSTGPFRYADIAPWYGHVERFAGISGSIENLPQLPDGQFLPPMDLNVVEKAVAARIKTRLQRHPPSHHRPRRQPHATDPGARQLPVPQQVLARLPVRRVFQHAVVDAARRGEDRQPDPAPLLHRDAAPLRQGREAAPRGVEVLDAETNQTYEFTAKIVFVCASAFNSTWLLMNSATEIWPDGLGSSSGELGHNAMDHHFRVGASGAVEGYLDRTTFGRRPNGFYIPPATATSAPTSGATCAASATRAAPAARAGRVRSPSSASARTSSRPSASPAPGPSA